MWQRVASQFSFWFEPSILACYRVHLDSTTSRIRLDAADVREVRELINITTAYHRPACSQSAWQESASCTLRIAVYGARETLIEVDSVLLGNRFLRPCVFVIAGASSGRFRRFLFDGFGSLHRDLNIV